MYVPIVHGVDPGSDWTFVHSDLNPHRLHAQLWFRKALLEGFSPFPNEKF